MALYAQNMTVQHRVIRFQLVRVQEVVVDRAEMADEVGLPGEFQRAGSGHVDDGGLLREVVGGLEGGVAAADDQDAGAGEVVGVGGDLVVALRRLDALDVRHVRPGEAGGHDDPPGAVDAAVLGAGDEVAGAGDLGDPGVVAHAQPVRGGVVGEVADVVVGGREIALGVGREERGVLVAEEGVPVGAHPALGVVPAGVHLVDGYEGAVPREAREERTRGGAGFHNEIASSRSPQEISRLQSGGPATDNEVVDRFFSGHCFLLFGGESGTTVLDS